MPPSSQPTLEAMIVIDGQGIIQFFSTAAERTFGYSEQEAVGLDVSELMPEPDHSRHASYLSRYHSTGKPRIIGIGRIVTGRRRDGTTFPMHLSIGEMQSGGKPYFTGFAHDLTEHQQTQDQDSCRGHCGTRNRLPLLPGDHRDGQEQGQLRLDHEAPEDRAGGKWRAFEQRQADHENPRGDECVR